MTFLDKLAPVAEVLTGLVVAICAIFAAALRFWLAARGARRDVRVLRARLDELAPPAEVEVKRERSMTAIVALAAEAAADRAIARRDREAPVPPEIRTLLLDLRAIARALEGSTERCREKLGIALPEPDAPSAAPTEASSVVPIDA